MGFLDYFKQDKTSDADNETRSITVAGGPTVSSWDSSFGYGRDIDKLSVVWGCVNLRADTVAQVPLKLLKKTDTGYVNAVEHPYYQLITKTPNPRMTAFEFWKNAQTQLDLFGNFYIQKLRNSHGDVLELNPLFPISVQAEYNEDGLIHYKFNMANPQDAGNSYFQEFTSEQIIHIKGYSRNGVYGVSVIDNFRRLFDGYAELEDAGTAIAKNAARPGSVITTPSNAKEDALEKAKAAWNQNYSRSNSGKTAWLPHGYTISATPAGLNAQEAEYISQRQFSAQRIATDIFRVPLHMLGLSGGPTYASVEQLSLEFTKYTISPLHINIEQQLNKQLLGDDDTVYTKFDSMCLMRGDMEARMASYAIMIQNGLITPNMYHQMENDGIYVSPDDGGDDFIRAVNYQKVDNSKPVAPVITPPVSASLAA